MLRSAAADAFAFAGERSQGLDRRAEIPPFECREAVRQCRKVRTGRVTPALRQIPDLASTSLERSFIAQDSLSEDDVQVGEPAARLRQCPIRIIVHRAPGGGIARMTRKLGAP